MWYIPLISCVGVKSLAHVEGVLLAFRAWFKLLVQCHRVGLILLRCVGVVLGPWRPQKSISRPRVSLVSSGRVFIFILSTELGVIFGEKCTFRALFGVIWRYLAVLPHNLVRASN